MTKKLRLTLIGLGLGRGEDRTAFVTLERSSTWTAQAVVAHDGEEVRHTTAGHSGERAALLAIADWLRYRFGASSNCLDAYGSAATIVGFNQESGSE